MPRDESVLCIPTAHVRAIGYFQGFRPADESYLARLLDPEQFSFRPRSQVETDPSFKQLIPYVILQCGEKVFQYRRGSSGGEKRLQALRSIGIGGHISTEDAAGGSDPYLTGMHREIAEEVDIPQPTAERFLGFICDDRTPVGSVHLGVVHLFALPEPLAEPREDSLVEPGWKTLMELQTDREQFETWSQFALEELLRNPG